MIFAAIWKSAFSLSTRILTDMLIIFRYENELFTRNLNGPKTNFYEISLQISDPKIDLWVKTHFFWKMAMSKVPEMHFLA